MSTSGGKSGGAPAASLRVGAPTRGTLAASHFRFPGRPGHEHTTLTRPTHNTGGVNLQPPSAAGRQVVDLPIPNAGAYLYSDFAGTPMCHSVLNLGGASAYIVIDIAYPDDKDLTGDMGRMAQERMAARHASASQ